MRFARGMWTLVAVAVAALAPYAAHAGLVGDTVGATLIDTNTSTSIFTQATAVVADPGGPEFSGDFSGATWTLDITDTGFVLTGICKNTEEGCPSDDTLIDLSLSITGLDFTPPGVLTALTNIGGTSPLSDVAESPVVGPSSVSVTFQSFSLGTGQPDTTTYSADFQVTPTPQSAPFPATLLLLGVGVTAAGLSTAWRRRR